MHLQSNLSIRTLYGIIIFLQYISYCFLRAGPRISLTNYSGQETKLNMSKLDKILLIKTSMVECTRWKLVHATIFAFTFHDISSEYKIYMLQFMGMLGVHACTPV